MIENLRERIQEEARRQIINNGYSKTTIRSVAQACNIGVGTMYNYYRSKEELVSSIMLEDWRLCIEQMEKAPTADAEVFLRTLQGALSDFIGKYMNIFTDKGAIASFAVVFSQRHNQLRGRLADIISPVVASSDFEDKRFLAEHVAESIINWSMEGISFDRQFSIIKKLL